MGGRWEGSGVGGVSFMDQFTYLGHALSVICFLDFPFTLKIGLVVSLSYIISHDGRNSIEIS